MPVFVKRLCIMTGIVSAVVAAYLLQIETRAGIIFAAAVFWSLANLWVWSFASGWILGKGPHRILKLTVLIVLKVLVLYVGGFLLLYRAAPLNAREALALVAGLAVVFLVALLKALGSWLLKRDLPSPGNGP
jgi:hypothetical protein